jgi:tight adherence protein B
VSAAAGLLALALLVSPAPAATRLGCAGGGRVLPARTAYRLAPAVAVGAAVVLLPIAVVAAALILTATVLARKRRGAQRVRRAAESTALRDALDIVAGELRVGAHPVAAFDAAAGEIGGEVGRWLRTVAARGRLGGDVGAGIRSVAQISAVPVYWTRLAVCWQLAQSHGLAVATLMRAPQHDIIERERFRARVDAGLAGARTTAAVLAGLPVLGIALGQLIGAEPLGFLFSGGVGGALLVIGIALSCLGLWWSDRIVGGLPT